MVKFSVFRQGLDRDVQELWARYLGSQLSMKAMLICSLLDISNTEITDKILEKCGVLEAAHHLDGSILRRNSDGLWRTKHPRWDVELLYFLYNDNSRPLAEQRKQDLRDSLIALYLMKEEEITYSALAMLYSIAAQNLVPINVVESVFQQSISQIPTYLSDEKKSVLYTYHIADAYYKLKKYPEAIDKLDDRNPGVSSDGTTSPPPPPSNPATTPTTPPGPPAISPPSPPITPLVAPITCKPTEVLQDGKCVPAPVCKPTEVLQDGKCVPQPSIYCLKGVAHQVGDHCEFSL